MSNLALDDLIEVYRQFKQLPPVVIAVWVIDSPGMVHILRGQLDKYYQSLGKAGKAELLSLYGIPVYEYYTWLRSPEDRPPKPVLYDYPNREGIWLEYNNGNFIKWEW